uniref:Fringe-like glycosyltransferase domain-containing protein n=1 Tax=Athene cunicularia TaxID=194338 RepID=A0A663MJ25_ATHCN
MGCRLIHGLSGAAVFIVSMALLSVQHRGAQETAQYPGTEGNLEDIFIAVKTTKRFNQSRMELLLDTWISQAREQVIVWIQTREGVTPWCAARVQPRSLPSTSAQSIPCFLAQIPSRA